MRRVVVTGLGMVTPLGSGVDHNWSEITAGKSGISKIENFDVLNHLVEQSSTIEESMIETQIHADLLVLIEELPDNQKEVLHMRLFQGMSFKEIGDHTGVSINTALGRMRYAVINLRKMIEDRNLIFTQ